MSLQSRLADLVTAVGVDIKGLQNSKMNAGVAGLPAGTTLTVSKTAGTWPVRPTSRTDIVVIWKGAAPSPAIVASGTAGMIDGVDLRFETP